jgi:hypothetical protein
MLRQISLALATGPLALALMIVVNPPKGNCQRQGEGTASFLFLLIFLIKRKVKTKGNCLWQGLLPGGRESCPSFSFH